MHKKHVQYIKEIKKNYFNNSENTLRKKEWNNVCVLVFPRLNVIRKAFGGSGLMRQTKSNFKAIFFVQKYSCECSLYIQYIV